MVDFATAAVPFSVGVKEAPTAFRAQVEELTIDPVTGSTFVSGRRIARVTVTVAYRGSPATGDRVYVWYGTELTDGTGANGDPDLVSPPSVGAEVLVLGSESELPSLGRVVTPLEVVGMSVVSDGSVKAPSGDRQGVESKSLTEVERTLRRPAVNVPQAGGETPNAAPGAATSPLPSTPPTPPRSQLEDVATFQKMLNDLGMTADEFMRLPPEEQERLVSSHTPG